MGIYYFLREMRNKCFLCFLWVLLRFSCFLWVLLRFTRVFPQVFPQVFPRRFLRPPKVSIAVRIAAAARLSVFAVSIVSCISLSLAVSILLGIETVDLIVLSIVFTGASAFFIRLSTYSNQLLYFSS